MLAYSVAVKTETPRHTVHLPTNKTCTVPVPGFAARTNNYPATVVVSSDGRYAALRNQGFGTHASGVWYGPYSDDTAIFMIEDDAQNGADYVHTRRSTAWGISKYSSHLPEPFVGITSIELRLGI
jgi:hypothetical protein